MPTCSVLGKIFGSIACQSAYINDMLDLKLAIYTPFAVNMRPGLFLASSDDFESFEFDEQVELGKLFGAEDNDFILLAHKSPLHVGKDHGVYAFGAQLARENTYECKFVAQKPSIQRMRDLHMVLRESGDGSEFVFTDSAFYFSHERLTPALIAFHEAYFEQIVAQKIEIDAYRDFLQPLGSQPIALNDFLKSANVCAANKSHVTLFEVLHTLFSKRNAIIMLCRNSDFYHLGTVNELITYYLSDKLEEAVKFRQSLCFSRNKARSGLGDAKNQSN